jgi:hypothetical protein
MAKKQKNGLQEGAEHQTTINPADPGEGSGANRASGLPRLAYSPKEASEMLGISIVSLWRLRRRKLIKCCNALRTVLVPHEELERFLRETMEASAL